MDRLLRELKKEILLLFTIHRRTAVLITGVPIIYTLLFGGMFYNNLIKDIPVVIWNQDSGLAGRSIVRNFMNADGIKVSRIVNSQADGEKAMADGTAYGLIVIPSDFSKQLMLGQNSAVEIIADNTNTMIGGTITRSAQAVIGNYNAEIAVNNRMVKGMMYDDAANSVSQGGISARSLYNPTGGYIDFFLGVLIVHAAQIGIVFVIGPSLVYEKKRRGRRLCQNAWHCIAAKLVVYSLLGLAGIAVCFSIAIGIFGMNSQSMSFQLAVILYMFLAAITAFGLCVGAWLRKPVQAISYPLFYIMPSVLFSGAIWPRSSMDSVSMTLSYILPISWIADNVRDLMQKGGAPEWGMGMAVLTGMMMIFYLLAVQGLKQTLGGKQVVQHN